MKQQPKIENFSAQPHPFRAADIPAKEEAVSLKLKTFVLSFIVCLLTGLGINYAQPAVYQSAATLLTSAATAIDQASKEVDYQHVAIQKQKLLGGELLSETLTRLKNSSYSATSPGLTELRAMISIEPIEQTNLLRLLALGPDPEILPVVINTLIDVYLDARALSVENATKSTVTLVKTELQELDAKLEQARMALDQFRKDHDISSSTREENESLTRLKGLTQALNDANEEKVKAKARYDAVNHAIAAGKAVVPKQDQKSLASMEQRYQELKEKQAELEDRYTPEYLALQPAMKIIPEQLKALEEEIKSSRQVGKKIVYTEVSREYYAAKQVVNDIRKQLDEHKQKAAEFTTLFSRHQKLMDDLTSLELLNRETRDRLIKIESKQFEKYPQVDVVERASVNWQAVSPDYHQGALIALIGALILAFLTTWLADFLTRKSPEQNNLIFPIQAWFRHSNEAIDPQQNLEKLPQKSAVEHKFRDQLTHVPLYEKISEQEIQLLLENSDKETEQLILLLLSGLTLDEIIDLSVADIDFKNTVVAVRGESPRTIKLGSRLQTLLAEQLSQYASLWRQQPASDELLAMLYCVTVDAGLTNLEQNLADVLRQTYIIFLVEQGLRLSALANIVGYLTPLALADYAKFSPPEKGRNSEQVQLIYPACQLTC